MEKVFFVLFVIVTAANVFICSQLGLPAAAAAYTACACLYVYMMGIFEGRSRQRRDARQPL
jgi:hypothetical protein